MTPHFPLGDKIDKKKIVWDNFQHVRCYCDAQYFNFPFSIKDSSTNRKSIKRKVIFLSRHSNILSIMLIELNLSNRFQSLLFFQPIFVRKLFSISDKYIGNHITLLLLANYNEFQAIV